MIVDLLQTIDVYIYDVFVSRLDWWAWIGLAAQALFSARFLVQWIASERAGRSIVPFSFWLLSIAGGLLLLVYALFRRDPVFILGQSLGIAIYLRNVSFVLRERRRNAKTRESGSPAG